MKTYMILALVGTMTTTSALRLQQQDNNQADNNDLVEVTDEQLPQECVPLTKKEKKERKRLRKEEEKRLNLTKEEKKERKKIRKAKDKECKRLRREEEKKKEEEDSTDQEDSTDDDENDISWTTEAKPVQKVCDGSLHRLDNEQTASIFDRYMAEDSSTELYTDVSMSPSNDMLWWEQASGNIMRFFWKEYDIGYKRVPELLNNNGAKISLWGEYDVRPAAVVQGSLGDCWWLAAAAALGEWPERVHKLFKGGRDADTEKGIYELEMFRNGEAVSVVVDDILPYVWESTPVNANRSPNKAWWVPIAEKAAAKYYGTYENMDLG